MVPLTTVLAVLRRPLPCDKYKRKSLIVLLHLQVFYDLPRSNMNTNTGSIFPRSQGWLFCFCFILFHVSLPEGNCYNFYTRSTVHVAWTAIKNPQLVHASCWLTLMRLKLRGYNCNINNQAQAGAQDLGHHAVGESQKSDCSLSPKIYHTASPSQPSQASCICLIAV